MLPALSRPLLGNALWMWFVGIGVAAATFGLLQLVKRALARRLERVAARTATVVDDAVAGLVAQVHPVFLLILALVTGASLLHLPQPDRQAADRLLVAAMFLQLAAWTSALIGRVADRWVRRRGDEEGAAATTAAALTVTGRIVVWTGVALVVLANLGVNVNALVAGLGVGSIAVALALQNILGDLFAAISIVLDRPFQAGDFIIVDAYLGVVEHIGLKSTRIRSLDGELIVFANADLLKSRIRNFKHMYERRVAFGFGVTYDTPPDRLAAIPATVREIIEAQGQTRFDRAHFKAFGASSLDFEVVFYVLSPDFNTYMDIQQGINLELCRRFQEQGVDFAFPTRTVLLRTEPTQP